MAGKYDACLIVHNICDKSTFHYARRLASTIRNGQGRSNQGGGGGKELPIVLVGNKSDLEHLRYAILNFQSLPLAQYIGMPWTEICFV